MSADVYGLALAVEPPDASVALDAGGAGCAVALEASHPWGVSDGANLHPFFSASPWGAARWWRSLGYTSASRMAYVTDEAAAEGWATVVVDPSGASANLALDAQAAVLGGVRGGEEYTLLVEVAGCTAPGSGAYVNINYHMANQMMPALGCTVVLPLEDGQSRVRLFSREGHPEIARLLGVQVNRGGYAAPLVARVRMSLYRGDYAGPYAPYSEGDE